MYKQQDTFTARILPNLIESKLKKSILLWSCQPSLNAIIGLCSVSFCRMESSRDRKLIDIGTNVFQIFTWHLHDDIIWLELPECISQHFCHARAILHKRKTTEYNSLPQSIQRPILLSSNFFPYKSTCHFRYLNCCQMLYSNATDLKLGSSTYSFLLFRFLVLMGC